MLSVRGCREGLLRDMPRWLAASTRLPGGKGHENPGVTVQPRGVTGQRSNIDRPPSL
jgi:hypothetical protein